MRFSTTRPRAVVALAMAIALILGLGAGALASHTFEDVPTSHQFHNDIDWLADTGITVGCKANEYCPGAPVTRGQMAAFLHRMVNQDLTGHYACPGGSFLATDGATPWARGNAETYATQPGVGENLFRCNVALPHGATVSNATFTVADFDPSNDVTCSLVRVDLLDSDIGTTVTMASASTTSTAGPQDVPDLTISSPTVDNENFAYFAECLLAGSSQTTIYGATVEYTYKGVPAP